MSRNWGRIIVGSETISYIRRVGHLRLIVAKRDAGGWKWDIIAEGSRHPDVKPIASGWRPTIMAVKQDASLEAQKLLCRALLELRPTIAYEMPKLALLCGRRGGLSHLRTRL